jgi:hypothetical protein
MDFLTQNYLLISYREDLDVLFLRWQSSVSSQELRAGYTEALARAEAFKAGYWLFDVRSRGLVSKEDEAWIIDGFFPLAETKLGYHNSFAYLVSPSHFTHTRKTIGLEKLAHYSSLTKIRLFTAEKDALQWLAERRQAFQQSA